MNNSKKSIHNSGPLGMLVRTGQIKKIDIEEPILNRVQETQKTAGSYFRTQSGVEFSEQELVFVNPKECEPWKYANRLEDEMGNMSELIASIRENKQLQPALVRPHPHPHDGIKYEIIFGRRRHQACLKLGVSFLVIKKDIKNLQEAIASQDAENKFRKNVSHYSNAMLYKKLLADRVFKHEKELAEKLGMPASTLNDLMVYTKVPLEIVREIPDIHSLSISMALKIISLLSESKAYTAQLIKVAPDIGKAISSPAKLDKAVKQSKASKVSLLNLDQARILKSKDGKNLFTLKTDYKGLTHIVFHKNIANNLDYDHLCDHLITYLEKKTLQSGAPD